MGKLVIRLGDILEELNINPYKFSQIAKIRHSTVYDMINNNSKSLRIENIEAILDTVNELSKEIGTGKQYDIQDLFKYKK
ncbi:helix-turn-helix domain-containing protein [Thermaerobacillus caldiproteolyticus]|uniref:helix-turn-helix domain-containing protein n=1 Tax=Thermaerobacillus caldiproteolyticus TaxID=247480 RepID=UPI00188A672B|nr:helix-turn-helix domain-containing protein [Anoxybacillus caldiproteolyticus]QPA33395.1 helix-turn-helix domain-containing protein [Anoxybacillus caldiproteolyticus]